MAGVPSRSYRFRRFALSMFLSVCRQPLLHRSGGIGCAGISSKNAIWLNCGDFRLIESITGLNGSCDGLSSKRPSTHSISNASRSEKNEFAAFKKSNKEWLDAYTRFIALKRKFDGCSWQFWPDEFRYYAKARRSIAKSGLSDETEAQAWYQFQFFKQWLALKAYANSRDVQVFGDIPIFVAMDSADVWTNPALFQMDSDLKPIAVAGVPPDYFSAEGQLWGNPAL